MAVLSGPSLLFAPVLDLGNGSYKVICVRIPMPAPESVHTREQMHSTSAVTGVLAVCTWTDDCAVTRLLRSGAHLSHCPYHARVDTVGTRPPARTHARTHAHTHARARARTHTHTSGERMCGVSASCGRPESPAGRSRPPLGEVA